MNNINQSVYSEIYRDFLIEMFEINEENYYKGLFEYQLISPDGEVIEGSGAGSFSSCLRAGREDVALTYRQKEIRAKIQEIVDFFIAKGFRDWEIGQALREFKEEYEYSEDQSGLPPNLIEEI